LGKKLIVCDLDGTLLDKQKKLSNNFSKRLNKLIKEGLDFTIATGRDFENTKKALRKLKFRNPIILTNGALLVDYPTGKVIEYLVIEHSIANNILEISKQYKLKPMVFASLNLKKRIPRFIKGRWWNPRKLKPLEEKYYRKYLKEPIISIQYCDNYKKLEIFKEKIEKKYKNQIYIIFFEDAFLKGKYWLEFNPKDAKKEIMLEKLIKIKNYDHKDVVVFGDQINDIGMFKLVGKSIAVKNAHPNAKKEADETILSNVEGGVILYLENHLEELI